MTATLFTSGCAVDGGPSFSSDAGAGSHPARDAARDDLLSDAAVGAGSHPARPTSLDEQLRALIRGELFDCLVCGAAVDGADDGRIACAACGSVLEPEPRQIEGQLALIDAET